MVINHFPKAFSNSSVFNSFQKTNNDAVNMISRGRQALYNMGAATESFVSPHPFHFVYLGDH